MEKNGAQDCQPIPSPGTLEFVENAIHELPADTHGILPLLMNQLAQPWASNSIDQGSPLPVAGWPGNQMAAGFQPLTQHQFGPPAEISTVDSRSTSTIGEIELSEKERKRLENKRANDRAFRQREKEKKQKLQAENQALKAEILRLKDKSVKEEQQLKSMRKKLTKFEAKKERVEGENLQLNKELAKKERKMNRLRGRVEYMEQQMGVKKHKKKLKKQVMMRETAEETNNDN